MALEIDKGHGGATGVGGCVIVSCIFVNNLGNL